jgi:hypothetical protein
MRGTKDVAFWMEHGLADEPVDEMKQGLSPGLIVISLSTFPQVEASYEILLRPLVHKYLRHRRQVDGFTDTASCMPS